MPNISMSPSARYVTQQSVWSVPLRGPLTDRRIAYYQKRGYFSQSAIVERKAQRVKRAASHKKGLSKSKVFAQF